MFIATFLLSCTNKNYTLEGKVDTSDLDGVTIQIKTSHENHWHTIAEVVVENQKFILKGKVEEPAIASLFFSDNEKNIQGSKAFILENAKIKFEIDENLKIKIEGTDANNLIQTFDNDLTSIVPQEFIDSMRNNLIPEPELETRVNDYNEKYRRFISDFSKDNVNTLSGTLVFQNNSRSIPLKEKITILDLMNDKVKSSSQIQAIIKQTEKERVVMPGEKFIDLKLPDTNGNILALSDLVGKTDYVLIDFWASWCGPCIRSFPELTEFYNKNKGKRFEILGVSFDKEEENWKAAIKKHNLTWKHVSDLKFWESEAGQLYAVNSIPCTILIDKNGIIIGRNMSLNEIAQLLK